MAEEQTVEAPEKKKSPMVKIIILAVVAVIAIAGTVVGTLFATGAFKKRPPPDAEQALDEHAQDAAKGGDGHGAPAGDGHGAPAADAHGAPAPAGDGHGPAPAAPAGDGHGAPAAPAADAHGAPAKDAKGGAAPGQPQRRPLPANAPARFEKSYMDLDEKKPLVANVAGSRKVLQVSLSLMTQYDDRVFKNVEKHRAALRSVCLDVLRQVVEADLGKPEAREQLANRLRDAINVELEKMEGFGGIEDVFFTEFVYQ